MPEMSLRGAYVGEDVSGKIRKKLTNIGFPADNASVSLSKLEIIFCVFSEESRENLIISYGNQYLMVNRE
jgi:hypothetical protein